MVQFQTFNKNLQNEFVHTILLQNSHRKVKNHPNFETLKVFFWILKQFFRTSSKICYLNRFHEQTKAIKFNLETENCSCNLWILLIVSINWPSFNKNLYVLRLHYLTNLKRIKYMKRYHYQLHEIPFLFCFVYSLAKYLTYPQIYWNLAMFFNGKNYRETNILE